MRFCTPPRLLMVLSNVGLGLDWNWIGLDWIGLDWIGLALHASAGVRSGVGGVDCFSGSGVVCPACPSRLRNARLPAPPMEDLADLGEVLVPQSPAHHA